MRGREVLCVLAFVGLSAPGCGDEGVPGPIADAGVADGAVDAGSIAAPPTPPDFGTCPSGWTEVMRAEVRVCEPWPAGAAMDCGPTQAHFPGTAGCSQIGTACPDDGWPEGLPIDVTIWHVRAGAAAGGDGSRARPLTSIRVASDRAALRPGGIIAVAVGVYDGVVAIPPDTILWGACAAETVLTNTAASTMPGVAEGVVQAYEGPGAVLQNVSIRDAAQPGILVGRDGTELRVTDVAIEGVAGAGVYATEHGRLIGTRILVRGTRNDPTTTLTGSGARAEYGGAIELEQSVLEDNVTYGAIARIDSELRLSGAAIRHTSATKSSMMLGVGVTVEASSTLVVVDSVIESSTTAGILVGAGSTLDATGVVIRDTDVEPARGYYGAAISAQLGGVATVRRLWASRNRGPSLLLVAGGPMVSVEDALIEDARPDDLGIGYGLSVQQGATAALTRTVISGSIGVSVEARDPDTHCTLRDVIVRDTLPYPPDTGGPPGEGGGGVWVHLGATSTLARVLVERTRVTAIGVSGAGSTLRLDDVVVRDTDSSEGQGFWGYGLAADHGGALTGARVEVVRARGFGVYAGDGNVQLEDLVVREIAAARCASTTCSEAGYGIGVGALVGTIDARRFEIDDATLCGVFVGSSASVDLMSGTVRRSEIGACVQDPAFEIGRISRDVTYLENARMLDTRMLPEPPALPMLP